MTKWIPHKSLFEGYNVALGKNFIFKDNAGVGKIMIFNDNVALLEVVVLKDIVARVN